MRRSLSLAAVFVAARAFAGPTGGADPHAVSATGFPGAYLGTVSLSLAADPRYGSHLLDAFSMHLQAVSVMTSRPEVAAYLEQSATGDLDMKSLRAALGREALDAPKAAALLLADALSRPEQFREMLDGLERLKPGLGRHAAAMLRHANVTGSLELLEALHDAGTRVPQSPPLTYGSDARLDRLFDELETGAAPSVSDRGPDGRSRAADLERPAQP